MWESRFRCPPFMLKAKDYRYSDMGKIEFNILKYYIPILFGNKMGRVMIYTDYH